MQGHDHSKMDKGDADTKKSDAEKMPATAHAEMPHKGDDDMTGMPHGTVDLSAATRATSAQKFAWAFLSLVLLAAGLIFSATVVNLNLSARDVGGAIMPPGMIMLRDTPGEAMRDMAAVDPRHVTFVAPANARGDNDLQPRLENAVKAFDLTTSVIKWNILPYEQVMGYAFNQQIPGPRIRITEGDRVRIRVTNNLPESTTVHWHGLILPNQFDGPAEITQEPIQPGESYTYEFFAQQAGTFFYHTHDHVDRQQALGLYGALLIDPRTPQNIPAYDLEYTVQLQEWLEREGYTFPAMLMEGGLPNFFTINGKAYPSTDTVNMQVGQKIRIRFIGSNNNFIHPMHIHGGPFTVVETDGNVVPESARIQKDTVNVGPGERYDVIWEAREPGKWLLHCHIPHHTTNNNVEEQGAGGLTMILNVTP